MEDFSVDRTKGGCLADFRPTIQSARPQRPDWTRARVVTQQQPSSSSSSSILLVSRLGPEESRWMLIYPHFFPLFEIAQISMKFRAKVISLNPLRNLTACFFFSPCAELRNLMKWRKWSTSLQICDSNSFLLISFSATGWWSEVKETPCEYDLWRADTFFP